jgi:IS605 OrfB family transposase
VKTYQYRIKDSKINKELNKLASKVNFVWNFCVETQKWAKSRSRKYRSAIDLKNLCSGSSQELNLNSVVIQTTCERFSESSLQHRRICRFRSYKRNLGWIPFKSNCVNVADCTVTFNKLKFKFWKSREIQGKILCGNFAQNTLGHWFVNIVTDYKADIYCGDGEVGIDLGSSTLLTLSNGEKIENPRYYRKYEAQLQKAQRDGKKRRVKKLHIKVYNSRKDYAHKVTTKIADENKLIVVGDIGSKKLAKTKMAKSTNDASWFLLKTLLRYKAIERGGVCLVVNEANTTRTCHVCRVVSDNSPKGLSGLKVREWQCECGAIHDRDVNSALNILRIGHDTQLNKSKDK